MRLVFLVAVAACSSWLVGCRGQQPIIIKSYAQATKLMPQYVRHYTTRRPVAWLGPPPGAATRLRCHRPGPDAVLQGSIRLLLDTGKEVPQPFALVVVDGKIAHADEAGNYAMRLLPGRHQVRAGGIGLLLSAAAPLQMAQGDSICLNFSLLQDSRPIICQ